MASNIFQGRKSATCVCSKGWGGGLCYIFFLSTGGTIKPLEQALEQPEDHRHQCQPHLEGEGHLPGAGLRVEGVLPQAEVLRLN